MEDTYNVVAAGRVPHAHDDVDAVLARVRVVILPNRHVVGLGGDGARSPETNAGEVIDLAEGASLPDTANNDSEASGRECQS